MRYVPRGLVDATTPVAEASTAEQTYKHTAIAPAANSGYAYQTCTYLIKWSHIISLIE